MYTRNAGLASAVAVALTLFGAAASAQTTPAPDATATPSATPGAMTPGASPTAAMQTPSATLNDTDKLFMLRSAQGDMGEISTSNMALKKAKSGDVKQVAQRLVMDHSQSLKEGSGLAVLLGLPMPKDPGLMNMAYAQKLMSAGGKDFDKQYMAGQVEAHENTVALYGMELSQGQDPQVKAFAAKYLPGVEAHTVQIYQVAKTVGAPDSSLRPAMPPTVNGVAPADMGSMGGTSSGSSSTGGTGAGAGGASAGAGTTGTGAGGGATGAAGQ